MPTLRCSGLRGHRVHIRWLLLRGGRDLVELLTEVDKAVLLEENLAQALLSLQDANHLQDTKQMLL